jgi:transcriptional regulator
MLRAIVGLELRITRLVGKAKMAQNKTPADVAALADTLAAQSDPIGEQWLREQSWPAAQRRAAVLADVATRRSPRP